MGITVGSGLVLCDRLGGQGSKVRRRDAVAGLDPGRGLLRCRLRPHASPVVKESRRANEIEGGALSPTPRTLA
jgi:hypothetical protein